MRTERNTYFLSICVFHKLTGSRRISMASWHQLRTEYVPNSDRRRRQQGTNPAVTAAFCTVGLSSIMADMLANQTPAQLAAGPRAVREALPAGMAASVWTGSELGGVASRTVPTGWAALDQELPSNGWPCGALVEVLAPQASLLEWRLLAPALQTVVTDERQVVLVGPPKTPCLAGLQHVGLLPSHLVWIRVDAPAQRLWSVEQLVRAGSAGAVLAWLPQARQEQIRRLQILAQSTRSLVFLFRPEAAQYEASAAPLRLLARHGVDFELHVEVFKRRGPAHVGQLLLPSIPGGLADVLTPRLLKPSALIANTTRGPVNAVGRAPAAAVVRSPALV